ncbi:protein-tyrosine phosphatase family protein [Lignipirellula cremea]|uniref:Dual specificity phosphatase, catalytic domain n=1 Tax=Lignipirellula cremea TaxID=2528010 RepID=A0A518E0P2_9BACT|nr:dual specificity protein phosphatase family protein [Lignipirellula cremea]QDU97631.1 Dual specificity phosphatase, catalytic domain [Lignipirellula cremea]
MDFELADVTTPPPTPSSYWVLPGRLLAGAYPGHREPAEHQARIHGIVDSGVRLFLNLMEENETNHAGQPFVPYAEVAAQRAPAVRVSRHAVRDLSIPTSSQMIGILDTIDASMASDAPVYVHCWGGVGRTGTVIGCWLLRHGLAQPDNVLEILKELRQQDQERRHRRSPETEQQENFVRHWLAQENQA